MLPPPVFIFNSNKHGDGAGLRLLMPPNKRGPLNPHVPAVAYGPAWQSLCTHAVLNIASTWTWLDPSISMQPNGFLPHLLLVLVLVRASHDDAWTDPYVVAY